MFDKYRYNSAFQLFVDATGVSIHNYNLNGNCITKNDVIKYNKQALANQQIIQKMHEN